MSGGGFLGGVLTNAMLKSYKKYEDKKALRKMDIILKEIVQNYCEYIDNHPEESNKELVEYLSKIK